MIDRFGTVEPPQAQRPERTAREPRRSLSFEDVMATRHDATGDSPEGARDQIEVTLLDRDGSGQSISLPWRLAANDALSQLFARFDADVERTLGGVPEANTSGRPVAGVAVVVASAAPRPDAALAAGTVSPSWAATQPSNPPQTPTHRESAPAPVAAAAGLAEPWQARLMRWLEGHDQRLTVRLRDYRLDESAQEQLVAGLFAFAREHGLRLQRIVINAREIWRSPA